MLGILAVILLVIWGAGLAMHMLGAFIWLFLAAAVISAIAHFLRGRSGPTVVSR